MLEGLTATKLLGGTAIAGILVAAWDKIKVYLSYVWGLFFVQISLNGSELRTAFLFLLRDEFKKMSFNKNYVMGDIEYVRPVKRNQLMAWIYPGNYPTIYRRGWKFLSCAYNRDTNNSYIISYFRWQFDYRKLIQEAIDKYNDTNNKKDWKRHDRFRIIKRSGSIGKSKRNFENDAPATDRGNKATAPEAVDFSDNMRTSTPIYWKLEDIGQPQKKSALNDLYYKDNVKEAIKEAFLWRDSEEWFKQRSIPWKRGFLLSGSPGTGKSAFTRALAQELNMPIVVFDLSTMNNSDFTNAWDTALEYAPCIALFEDIDAVFDGRKNIISTGMDQGLSFDFFLNIIDGVQNSDGVFKIVTTNNPDKIDPALGNVCNGDEMSTRPGRIDRVVHFNTLDDIGKEKMAQRILGDFPREEWQHIFEKAHDDTGAQFQERCCRIALQLFWQAKNQSPTT